MRKIPSILERVSWRDFTEYLHHVPRNREEYLQFLEFTYNTKLVSPFPMYVYLEPTNFCNMKCPMCAHSRMKREKGFMPLPLARKILDECGDHGLYYLTIHSLGEPLLHKDLVEIVAYAKKRVKVVAVTTNGLLLDEQHVAGLCDSGLSSLIISFAVTREKFLETRGPGYEKVEQAIRAVAEYKRTHGLKDPFLSVVCVLTDETEEQTAAFVEKFKPYLNAWDLRPLHRVSLGNVVYDKYGTGFDTLPNIRIPCRQLWKHLVIAWNGRVTACSQDAECELEVGNVNRQTLAEIWNSDELNRQRMMHLSGRYDRMPLCKNCPDWDWQ